MTYTEQEEINVLEKAASIGEYLRKLGHELSALSNEAAKIRHLGFIKVDQKIEDACRAYFDLSDSLEAFKK